MDRDLDMFYGTSLNGLYRASAEVQQKYAVTYDEDQPRGTEMRKAAAERKRKKGMKKNNIRDPKLLNYNRDNHEKS